jgi:gamma-butyrobetaine dioxygenase
MYIACLAGNQPPSIRLQDGDGRLWEVNPKWLRQRCRSSSSIDQRTGQRLYNLSDLDPDLSIQLTEERAPGQIRVVFTDGHAAIFEAADILAAAARAPFDDGTPAPEPWTGSLNALPTAAWSAAAAPDALRNMLDAYLRRGFLILESVPAEPGHVLAVARRFGFPRETNFGLLFDVRSVPEANDLAYTALALDPHTDNPYRDPVPGIQLLHCLVNDTRGGLSTLVDGLAVAEALRAEAPDAFATLTTTPIRFRFRDDGTDLVACLPLIELDIGGRVRAVHFSPRLDDAPFMASDALNDFYRAQARFDRMCRSAEFEIRFRLDPGDLVMFDNRRLLHGRTGFDPAEGLRHLQGCYIDGDGPRSLYRVLQCQRLET